MGEDGEWIVPDGMVCGKWNASASYIYRNREDRYDAINEFAACEGVDQELRVKFPKANTLMHCYT